MLRASTVIKDARLDREIQLGDVSQKIKIPLKYLQAIEEENPKGFPQEPYCSLIVKDYAEYLGLDGQQTLSLFRRDYAQKRKVPLIRPRLFIFTPKFTASLIIILSLLVFSGYLIYEYLAFNHPPNLKVNWPSNLTVADSFFDLSGTTDREATVRVNQDLVIVDHNGGFEKRISLFSSETKITVEAKSASGRITVVERTIKTANDKIKN